MTEQTYAGHGSSSCRRTNSSGESSFSDCYSLVKGAFYSWCKAFGHLLSYIKTAVRNEDSLALLHIRLNFGLEFVLKKATKIRQIQGMFNKFYKKEERTVLFADSRLMRFCDTHLSLLIVLQSNLGFSQSKSSWCEAIHSVSFALFPQQTVLEGKPATPKAVFFCFQKVFFPSCGYTMQ